MSSIITGATLATGKTSASNPAIEFSNLQDLFMAIAVELRGKPEEPLEPLIWFIETGVVDLIAASASAKGSWGTEFGGGIVVRFLRTSQSSKQLPCEHCGRPKTALVTLSPNTLRCAHCAILVVGNACVFCGARMTRGRNLSQLNVCDTCNTNFKVFVNYCGTCGARLIGPDRLKAGLCDICAENGNWLPWREDVLEVMGKRPQPRSRGSCSPQCTWLKARSLAVIDALSKLNSGIKLSVATRKELAGFNLPTDHMALTNVYTQNRHRPGKCVHSRPGTVRLGVELELYPQSRQARLRLRDAISEFAVLKFDRSIEEGRGAEIVTLPLTIEEHFLSWKPLFSGILSECQVDERCGLHVHVDKPNESASMRMVKFITRPLNNDFIEGIAGRESNAFCLKRPSLDARRALQLSRDHHSALATNASRTHGRTNELRIFSATLDWNIFLARLEFALALNHFAVSQHEMLHDNFCAWLKDQPYPYLKYSLKLRKSEPKGYPGILKATKRHKVYPLMQDSPIVEEPRESAWNWLTLEDSMAPPVQTRTPWRPTQEAVFMVPGTNRLMNSPPQPFPEPPLDETLYDDFPSQEDD